MRMEFSNKIPRVNVNKQLTKLLSGYQDLADRYGTNDPLVRCMKDEVELRHVLPDPPQLERRHALVRSGVWNRKSQRPSLRP